MKAVDVFHRVYRIENFFRVHLLRQRELHEDGVHFVRRLDFLLWL